MKILVLTWEFPPRLVGGIARHCAELYPEIVRMGHEVHVVTVAFGTEPQHKVVGGIHVHRVDDPGVPDPFLPWVRDLNYNLLEYCHQLLAEHSTGTSFDLIHAHDWLVAAAAIALQTKTGLPLVSTIHATEFGRHNGIRGDDSIEIFNQEHQLTDRSSEVIVCSNYMQREVRDVLGRDYSHIIYNGINPEKKQRPQNFDFWQLRRTYAADHEKIIYYVGRMTPEKGIFLLLDAALIVLWEMEGAVKLVFIGKGDGNIEALKRKATELGIGEKCYFTGFMSDQDLDKFQTVADCAVFPSLYEPFGIVALESFASHVPVVVSDAGGLPEVVRHSQTGIVTWKNNSDSLAWGILEVLRNPSYSKWLTDNAYSELSQRFYWPRLATQTLAVYEMAVASEEKAP
jgi:glycosyltransferase involved in cell wall biosynthesis